MTQQQILWAPWPGPQTVFCAATEFEVLFGGSKGPGKSDCLLMAGTAQVHLPRYKALILRESFPELQELIDRSHAIFPHMASAPVWNGQEKRWTWPQYGTSLTFGYCATVKDLTRYHGQEWAYIGFDEVGNLAEEKVWELLIAECRCPNPNVIRMMRGSANPGKAGHPWIKRRFIDKCGKAGERIHTSTITLDSGRQVKIDRRYIPARVLDNPVYANDPLYMAQLQQLPETLRKQLLYGDWDAGYGTALDELDREVHLVPAFEVPAHWTQFGGFDWGYAHNWVFGWFAANEDGDVFCVDTVRGRRHLPHEIAERILSVVPVHALQYIVAGHDVTATTRARGENTPTVAEQFQEFGLFLQKANIDRKQGLNNLRRYLAWRGLGRDGEGDGTPGVRLMDTPGNNWLFEQLQSMITDEQDMEDVLKVNADALTGQGGDDGYDMFRYAMASRPPRAQSTFFERPVRAWAPETLAYEVETKYRDGPDTSLQAMRRRYERPFFGGFR